MGIFSWLKNLLSPDYHDPIYYNLECFKEAKKEIKKEVICDCPHNPTCYTCNKQNSGDSDK